MKYIVTCKCGDSERFAVDAAAILYKDDPDKSFISAHGEGEIRTLAQRSTGKLKEYLKALAQTEEKFAFGIQDEPWMVWDLFKGRQIE